MHMSTQITLENFFGRFHNKWNWNQKTLKNLPSINRNPIALFYYIRCMEEEKRASTKNIKNFPDSNM